MKNSKLSEALKRKWASGTRKPSTFDGETISERLRNEWESGIRNRQRSESTRMKISLSLIGKMAGKVLRKTPISAAEKARLSERTKNNPLTGAVETNIRARTWRLRSPNNQVFEFRNCVLFIRSNVHLFDSEDVRWRRKGSSEVCHASQGLSMLSIRKKNPISSWKGWTWYSQTERLKHDGSDLLDRPVLEYV